MIIGSPKSLKDVPVFSKLEIEELSAGAMEMIKQGIPGEVPAAVPLKHLLRITATLMEYREVVLGLSTVADESPSDAMLELIEKAKALVAAQEPKAVQPVKAEPKSRLAIPK